MTNVSFMSPCSPLRRKRGLCGWMFEEKVVRNGQAFDDLRGEKGIASQCGWKGGMNNQKRVATDNTETNTQTFWGWKAIGKQLPNFIFSCSSTICVTQISISNFCSELHLLNADCSPNKLQRHAQRQRHFYPSGRRSNRAQRHPPGVVVSSCRTLTITTFSTLKTTHKVIQEGRERSHSPLLFGRLVFRPRRNRLPHKNLSPSFIMMPMSMFSQ